MKPFGVVSDTHLHNWSAFSGLTKKGVNTRLQEILDTICQAAEAVKARGGKRLYHAGDLFHVRGSIPPSVLNPVISAFTEMVDELGIEFRMIAGNHDLESNDSNALGNAAEALRSIEGVRIISNTWGFDDDQVAMLPWHDKMDDLRESLQSVAENLGDARKSWTIIIHAPVNGIIMGIPDHGFDADELESYGFGLVMAGHYHDHRALTPTVYSVGATTHQTFGDIGTKAGFCIVTEVPCVAVEHVESLAPKFVDYDDLDAEDDAQLIEQVAGNYLRIKLDEVTEKEIKEMRESAIEHCGAAGVIINATPKREVSVRKGVTVTAGETLIGSVSAWVDANEVKSDKTALLKECESVLDDIEEDA